MRLYVVRHAKAGDRKRWKDAPDARRPLSNSGRAQSAALADRLIEEKPSLLVSSPILRCVQTLEPLGELAGLDVEADDRLMEGASFEESLALLQELPDRAVVCSHGDVIPDLISALARRGMALTTEPDWRKATVWVLDGPERRTDDDEPIFTTATVEHPPHLD